MKEKRHAVKRLIAILSVYERMFDDPPVSGRLSNSQYPAVEALTLIQPYVNRRNWRWMPGAF